MALFSLDHTLIRGLTDNSESETFPLRYKVGGKSFPCQYVKVIPLQSWGGMLFSVWFMELHGITDETRVSAAQEWQHQVSFGREKECHLSRTLCMQYYRRQALRLCMKHLRDCEYTDAYLSLQKHSRVELEHPLLSKLHTDLVVHGNFEAAEAVMQQASKGVCVCLRITLSSPI